VNRFPGDGFVDEAAGASSGSSIFRIGQSWATVIYGRQANWPFRRRAAGEGLVRCSTGSWRKLSESRFCMRRRPDRSSQDADGQGLRRHREITRRIFADRCAECDFGLRGLPGQPGLAAAVFRGELGLVKLRGSRYDTGDGLQMAFNIAPSRRVTGGAATPPS